MGVFGAGLFDDDETQDLRDLYKSLKKFGISGEEAISILAKNSGVDMARPAEYAPFFLATASLLWKDGRLPNSFNKTTLALINSKADLPRWKEDAKLLKKRVSVIEKLAEQLRSPQPNPVKLPKCFIEESPWRIGELIAFPHSSGNTAILRVVGHFSKFGGKSPIVEVLDWNKPKPPTDAQLQTLGLMPRRCPILPDWTPETWKLYLQKNKSALPADYTQQEHNGWFLYPLFALIRSSENDKVFAKARRLNVVSQSPRRFLDWMLPLNGWCLWKDFDQSRLQSYFHDSFPSHMDFINRASREYEKNWRMSQKG
jgi:hypothetical protein